MKIVNVCNKSYIDGWGYQENLLPEYEFKAGHDVTVIGSANHFLYYVDEKTKKEIIGKGRDYYYNGVHVIRKNSYIETTYLSFLCTGIFRTLVKEKPDILFVHNINSSSLVISVLYTLFHKKTKMYVDNHEDNLNISKSILWNIFIKKGLLRIICRLSSFVVTRFYGVTPARCDYLHDVFGVEKKKIGFLPLGGDIDKVNMIEDDISVLRSKYSLPSDSFIICSGGKMAKWKGTEDLICAFEQLREKHPNTFLLFFGKFEDKDTEDLARNTEGIILYNWLDREETLEILKLSDVALWPLHHTTLIDDAVACGTPIIVRETGNTSHLIDGNGIFLHLGNKEEIIDSVNKMMLCINEYKFSALKMKEKYSYRNVVQTLLNDYQYDNK